MWDGTLVYDREFGSIKELIEVGVSILGAKKLTNSPHKMQVKCRFTQETLEKLMDLENSYIWTGRWTGKKHRRVGKLKESEDTQRQHTIG